MQEQPEQNFDLAAHLVGICAVTGAVMLTPGAKDWLRKASRADLQDLQQIVEQALKQKKLDVY